MTEYEFIHVSPENIEAESFRIIGEELKAQGIVIPREEEPVTKRVIHTTADFSYAQSLTYSLGAIERAHELIRQSATIITDTNMGLAGINKGRLNKYGCRVVCFMADEEVGRQARERGVTRAWVSMEVASRLEGPKIFVVGNAPTALLSLHEMMEKEIFVPDFVIGVPVGFVNVEYSKELFRNSSVPYIINFGRKGGSNVAAAIVNGLTLSME